MALVSTCSHPRSRFGGLVIEAQIPQLVPDLTPQNRST
jgi:hypothetical protein